MRRHVGLSLRGRAVVGFAALNPTYLPAASAIRSDTLLDTPGQTGNSLRDVYG
jgi:hypothetical protein